MRRIACCLIATLFASNVAYAADELLPAPKGAPPLLARGIDADVSVQIGYTCEANKDQGFAWVFKAPEANLFDKQGRQIGTLLRLDLAGSHRRRAASLSGEVAGFRFDAPASGAIPWLLLKAQEPRSVPVLRRTRPSSVASTPRQGVSTGGLRCRAQGRAGARLATTRPLYQFFRRCEVTSGLSLDNHYAQKIALRGQKIDGAPPLLVALAQLNPKSASAPAISAKVRAARASRTSKAPTCADGGATPRRILPRGPGAEAVVREALPRGGRGIARRHEGRRPALFVATPWHEDGKLYNAIICLDKGEIVGKRYKVDLPNYGVVDDKRVFAPGPMPGPLVVKGVRIGVPICEDVWTPDVVECISETGGEILLVPNASPYEVGKTDVRACSSPSAAWSRAACRWSISIRSAARTRWSATAAHSSWAPTDR